MKGGVDIATMSEINSIEIINIFSLIIILIYILILIMLMGLWLVNRNLNRTIQSLDRAIAKIKQIMAK